MDRKLGLIVCLSALPILSAQAMSVRSYIELRAAVTSGVTLADREQTARALSAYFQAVGETLEALEKKDGTIDANGAKICKPPDARLRGELVRAAADAEIVRWQDGTRNVAMVPGWKDHTVPEFAVFGLMVIFPCK